MDTQAAVRGEDMSERRTPSSTEMDRCTEMHTSTEMDRCTAMHKLPRLADTHCHIFDVPIAVGEEYGAETAEVVERAVCAGVARMLVIGSDLRTSRGAVAMAERYASSGVYAAVGIHPHDVCGELWGGNSTERAGSLQGIPRELRELSRHQRVVAIGETGLDYYYDHSPREQQQASFREHIRFAEEIGKPLVVHARDSYGDLVRILLEEAGSGLKAVVHCFSGNEEDARALLDMGFFLSFGGPLTFPKNEPLRELFRTLPEDRILLETDSPWLSPHPFRGRRNEPARVRLVYEKAAEVRGVAFEDFAARIERNADTFFGWKDEYLSCGTEYGQNDRERLAGMRGGR